jgi:endonuclease/exonuclease/phosphatase family metal-dependent hydrolase
MTGTNKGSAGILGKKCGKTNNKCLKLINKYLISAFNDDFDFIALQEASNYEKLIISNNYKYVHYKQNGDLEDMVTIYNSNKYILKAYHFKLLFPGRPCQILFFTHKQNNKKFIFINLHNEHNISQKNLEKKISKNANKGTLNKLNDNISSNNDLQNDDLTKFYTKKSYIIIAGDFNDHNKYNYYIGLNIFNNIIKSDIKPTNSCYINIMDKIGDYILYSNNFNITSILSKEFNKDLGKRGIASDHIPIYTILTYKNKIFK